MKAFIRSMLEPVTELFFPHTCAACGSNVLPAGNGLCAECLFHLPVTGFLQQPGNPVEQVFWGRLRIEQAAACCFFSKKSRVQELLHQVKYNYRKDAGLQVGQWMGYQLSEAAWFASIDFLLPMPLHPKRQLKRGYNQAELLCSGISSITGKVFQPGLTGRKSAAGSQTKQHRGERLLNMQEAFVIHDPAALENAHVLLVDDVVTTGATLEAMGSKLLQVKGLRLSICCFAYTLPH